MIHLVQSLSDGSTQLVDVPVPAATGPSLVVESRASVVSAGTERMLVDFGRAGWLEKARRQPDKARQVIDKVRTDGLRPTLEAVRAKLDAPIPIGYCQAGVVIETGPRVERFAPGDRVVTNGPHAEYVRVAHTLAAHIPERRDVRGGSVHAAGGHRPSRVATRCADVRRDGRRVRVGTHWAADGPARARERLST